METIALLLLGLFLQPASSETDEASTRAKRQVERLMNAGLPFAEKALVEHGEFAPFGAVMLPDGLIQTVAAGDAGEQASAERVYERLSAGLREGVESSAYRAVATFVMVRMRDPADGERLTALHVALEHRDGYCVDVYYPIVSRNETLVLDEAVAGARAGTYFDTCR